MTHIPMTQQMLAEAPTRQVRRHIERIGGMRLRGFDAIPSQRIAALIQRKLLGLAFRMRGKSQRMLELAGLPTNMAEAQEEAQRQVVRDLPVEPMVRSHAVKPSKSDDPAYRTGTRSKSSRK